MKRMFFHTLFVALLINLFLVSPVLAHGQPTITVEPTVASPGGQVTVTGTDMEDGEIFKLTLESVAGVADLGEATAKQDGDEAGFTTMFTMPSDLSPGSYLIRAATDEGETTTADLTIAAASQRMSLNQEPKEANPEPFQVDRSKSPLIIGSVVVLALLSAGLGVGLIRWRE